jgi:hypothetical protein
MCLQRRASVHHVRARTLRFASGGDDYLFILIVESCKVRAIASPAAASATLATAIDRVAAALGMSMLCCSRMPSAHGPHKLWTAAACAVARSSCQLGWRATNGKFRSGLFPKFELQPRALCYLVRFDTFAC